MVSGLASIPLQVIVSKVLFYERVLENFSETNKMEPCMLQIDFAMEIVKKTLPVQCIVCHCVYMYVCVHVISVVKC